MSVDEPKREMLALTNSNKALVFKHLDEFIAEWRAWLDEVEAIVARQSG